MSQKEVIRFACGLTADTQAVLEFVYEMVLHDLVESETIDEDISGFLQSMWNEVSYKETVRPLRNRYINVIDDKRKDKAICIPSRYYVFKDPRDIVKVTKFKVDRQSNGLRIPAECSMDLNGSDQFYGTLRLLQKINKYQEVLISWLAVADEENFVKQLKYGGTVDKADTSIEDNLENSTHDYERNNEDFDSLLKGMLHTTSEEYGSMDAATSMADALQVEDDNNTDAEIDNLIIDTVQISKSITSLRLEGCVLSHRASHYIVHQLHGCDKITELDLTGVTQVLDDLGDAIGKMTLLRSAAIHSATPPGSQSLMSGLSHCQHLEELYLQENTLTGCLTHLFGGLDHRGFQYLGVLELSNTKLGEADLTCISKATEHGKLPELRQLHLSHNILTNNIECLLDTDYPSLDWLWLDDTHTNKADIKHLSEAVHDGKLQELKDLNLSDNPLTSCLVELLGGTHHYGFHSLAHLQLKNTQLDEDDLLCLTKAVKSEKVPKLTWLYLEGNNLCTMEDQVMSMIQMLKKIYKKKEVFLYLDDNNMGDRFRAEIESGIKGSGIHLMDSQDSYY